MPRTPNVAPALSRTRPARACTTAPTTAAVPTTTSEAVVAWCGLWPSRYTRAGTVRMDPPPPSAPRLAPISSPAATASRITGSHHPAGAAAGGHDGQPGARPGVHSPGQVDHLAALTGQHPGGQGGPVAGAAHGDHGALWWQILEPGGKVAERGRAGRRGRARPAIRGPRARPAGSRPGASAGWPAPRWLWAGAGTGGRARRSCRPRGCRAGDQGESGISGAGVLVVDGDHGVPGCMEEGRGDDGAVSGAAVHPDLAPGDFADTGTQVLQRDVQRAVEAAAGPFECAAHVQDGDRAVVAHSGQVSETRDGKGCQRLAARPFLRGAVGGAGEVIDADPGQVALGGGDLPGGVAEQGQRGSPRDQPAEVVREVGAVLEAQRSADVTGRARLAVAQIGDPFSGGDAEG